MERRKRDLLDVVCGEEDAAMRQNSDLRLMRINQCTV